MAESRCAIAKRGATRVWTRVRDLTVESKSEKNIYNPPGGDGRSARLPCDATEGGYTQLVNVYFLRTIVYRHFSLFTWNLESLLAWLFSGLVVQEYVWGVGRGAKA